MNVLVVVIDALRFSDVGCYGREDEITPNIDRLAADSMVFDKAFAGSNKTDVSMSTIFSGKLPREHGVTHHGTVHTSENLERIERRSPVFLPERLREAGYTTIGVDWMGRWHEWGYDHYGVDGSGNYTSEDPKSPGEWAFGKVTDVVTDLPRPLLSPIMKLYHRYSGYYDFRVNCEELTDIAINRIDDADDPFFTLLHYWDVHPPYLPPEEYTERFRNDDNEPLDGYFGPDAKGPLSAAFQTYATGDQTTMGEAKAAYDGAIAWVDNQLGRLFDYLREANELEETMVIVTADHGHNFGEHGIFSDNVGLYDTSIRVPLIVYDPRRDHRRVEGLAHHIDLAPTILEYAGLDVPPDLRGNVLPETREHVFAEAIEHRMQMLRTDDWKLIVPDDVEFLQSQYWYDGDGEPQLYNLSTDPDETRDVADEHPDMLDKLKTRLEEKLDKQSQIAESARDRNAEIDDKDMAEIKSRLSALGYADDDNV